MIPGRLALDRTWGDYLEARHALVTRLADEVRHEAGTQERVPAWAAALIQSPLPDVIAGVEVWRAAHQIPDTDLRPTGPVQRRRIEADAQHQLENLVAQESEPVLNWLGWIREAVPATVKDPETIRLARECAHVDPGGVWLRDHVRRAADRPLPDDHKADALRYRLEKWLEPAWKEAAKSTSSRRPPANAPGPTPRHSAGIGG